MLNCLPSHLNGVLSDTKNGADANDSRKVMVKRETQKVCIGWDWAGAADSGSKHFYFSYSIG